jgi:hypothetical protein
MQNPFADYARRLSGLIRQPGVPIPDPLFNDLARHLFRLQYQHVDPYRTFAQARAQSPDHLQDWKAIPAIPTASFKEVDWTSLPSEQRQRVFHSSGTTSHVPSRQFHNQESLALYEASALSWFRLHLMPKLNPLPFVLALTPAPDQVPRSSLVHMLDVIRRSHAEGEFEFVGALDGQGGWRIDAEAVETVLLRLAAESRPATLLGTAFSFVFLLEHLVERGTTVVLPPGSRAMETGGYKGRSRELSKASLHELIEERLGIPSSNIVSEYGMTELSSQAYDHSAGHPVVSNPRRFRFPPWARTLIVAPETGREVAEGETGLLRVVDLANLRSVAAVQTEDLATRRGDGFELLGRASNAEPRGCSLLSARG